MAPALLLFWSHLRFPRSKCDVAHIRDDSLYAWSTSAVDNSPWPTCDNWKWFTVYPSLTLDECLEVIKAMSCSTRESTKQS